MTTSIATWVTPEEGITVQREYASPLAALEQAQFAESVGCKGARAFVQDGGVARLLYPFTPARVLQLP